jgi:hypothetical protein
VWCVYVCVGGGTKVMEYGGGGCEGWGGGRCATMMEYGGVLAVLDSCALGCPGCATYFTW